jgi:hypothetical protein
VCLLLFLIPALCGGLAGSRTTVLRRELAAAVAVSVTIAVIISWTAAAGRWIPDTWLLQAAMTLPAWYLLADTRRDSSRRGNR